MKFITLIFTMIAFAAFGMAADAKAEKRASPIGVESQTDPPDCVSITTATQESPEQFNINHDSPEARSTAYNNSTQSIVTTPNHSRFGRLCSTADGGCGRLYGEWFDSDTNSASNMAHIGKSG